MNKKINIAYINFGVSEMWHVLSGELFIFLPIHLQLTSLITWENGCRKKKKRGKKNKPLVLVVVQSFPMASVIAFPVQIAQFAGRPDKGSSIHRRMGEHIFSWLILGILFSNGCSPLAQMTNFHLHCEKTWGDRDTYCVYIFHTTLNKQKKRKKKAQREPHNVLKPLMFL